MVNALLRYYRVKEILLPPRKPGEPLPSSFLQFYEHLMGEAASDGGTGVRPVDEQGQLGREIDSSDDALGPRRIEDPVREHFQSVQQQAALLDKLPGPDPTIPEKKVCIIFHGAPFTGTLIRLLRLRVPVSLSLSVTIA